MSVTNISTRRATKLDRITWLSQRDPKKEFACLMHHFNEESLWECFRMLDGNRATGVDKVSKAVYGQDHTTQGCRIKISGTLLRLDKSRHFGVFNFINILPIA
jgi:hypothetical protein